MAGRQVKCQDTGELRNSEELFKAPNKKYYSSKEAWERIEQNKIYRQKCIDFLMDLLGYKPGMKLPTVTFKMIKEYEEPYGLDVLYATMVSQRQSCEWALMNKSFAQETAKIFYLFAIFQNNAMTEWKKKVAAQKSIQMAEKQAENLVIEEESDMTYVPQKKKDIRRFLD